ncbi:WD40-repeat-containing domain protein [Cenococcum geophilum]
MKGIYSQSDACRHMRGFPYHIVAYVVGNRDGFGVRTRRIFSHDSKLLASAPYDHTVKVWDAATGSLQQTLESHSDSVMSVAFSHDSKLLASASHDHTVKVWDTVTSSCRQTIPTDASISRLSFDSSNLNILTNTGCIKVDRPESSQELGGKGDRQGWGISRSWVTWNGQNLLWLPPDYRAIESDISQSGSRVAFGCHTGRVFIIGFSSAILHAA